MFVWLTYISCILLRKSCLIFFLALFLLNFTAALHLSIINRLLCALVLHVKWLRIILCGILALNVSICQSLNNCGTHSLNVSLEDVSIYDFFSFGTEGIRGLGRWNSNRNCELQIHDEKKKIYVELISMQLLFLSFIHLGLQTLFLDFKIT